MNTRSRLSALTCVLLAIFFLADHSARAAQSQPNEYLVYVGTYTGKKSKGIYAYRLEMKSGALKPLGLVAENVNPTFLEIHPNHKFLYAANEIDRFGGNSAGAMSAFSIDAESGKLTLLNQQSSGGPGP